MIYMHNLCILSPSHQKWNLNGSMIPLGTCILSCPFICFITCAGFVCWHKATINCFSIKQLSIQIYRYVTWAKQLRAFFSLLNNMGGWFESGWGERIFNPCPRCGRNPDFFILMTVYVQKLHVRVWLNAYLCIWIVLYMAALPSVSHRYHLQFCSQSLTSPHSLTFLLSSIPHSH